MKTVEYDLNKLCVEADMYEDKAKKAMIDAAHLADELHNDQNYAKMKYTPTDN